MAPEEGTFRIREERSDDIPDIREVNQQAFERSEEANIVDALRLGGAITASLVAVEHDHIVGHLLFTPVAFEAPSLTTTAVGLGPVAVLPERQGHGIGSMLIQKGIGRLRPTAYNAVVLIGHAVSRAEQNWTTVAEEN